MGSLGPLVKPQAPRPSSNQVKSPSYEAPEASEVPLEVEEAAAAALVVEDATTAEVVGAT